MPLAQHAQESGTILTVGTEKVSAADFQHVFLKNNRDSVITEAALNEYMELFINFKLKVQAAEALGMDTIETFQRELAGYRTQLARPYLDQQRPLARLGEASLGAAARRSARSPHSGFVQRGSFCCGHAQGIQACAGHAQTC